MSSIDDLPEDEDDELEDGPAPANTIAGPQTPRDKVMQRIAQVRTSGGQPDEQEDEDEDESDPRREAALQFGKSTALTTGVGRALNALAAGTGYKPDDSEYNQMDKQPDVATKDLDRSATVTKAIEDRKAKADALSSTLAQKQASLDAQTANNQTKNDAYNRRTDTMGKLAGNRSDTATIRAANTVLNDKNAQNEVKKLQASRSAQSLIDGIRNGDITGSKNVSRQLTNMISTIEMGTPGGQGDRQAVGIDTLYGKLKGALGYVEGKPEGVIPKDYLDQTESETHALGDRAAANYKNLTDGALSGADLSAGNPDADTGKVYTLAKQRRDILMKSNGYDPDTGQPTTPRPKKGGAAGGLIPEANAATQGPKVGTISKGYIYTGGNPQDPHSWAKAQ
jgi:hypothetical protein